MGVGVHPQLHLLHIAVRGVLEDRLELGRGGVEGRGHCNGLTVARGVGKGDGVARTQVDRHIVAGADRSWVMLGHLAVVTVTTAVGATERRGSYPSQTQAFECSFPTKF